MNEENPSDLSTKIHNIVIILASIHVQCVETRNENTKIPNYAHSSETWHELNKYKYSNLDSTVLSLNAHIVGYISHFK